MRADGLHSPLVLLSAERCVSVCRQLAMVRQHLAGVYARQQRWREAAKVLTAIPLETGQKQYSAEYRLQTYVKIARLCLEEDDPDTAETYITRAGVLVVRRYYTPTNLDHLRQSPCGEDTHSIKPTSPAPESLW